MGLGRLPRRVGDRLRRRLRTLAKRYDHPAGHAGNQGDDGPEDAENRPEHAPRRENGIHPRLRRGQQKARGCAAACAMLPNRGGNRNDPARAQRQRHAEQHTLDDGHDAVAAQVTLHPRGAHEHGEYPGNQKTKEQVRRHLHRNAPGLDHDGLQILKYVHKERSGNCLGIRP